MKVPILFIHGIREIGGAERELLLILKQLQGHSYNSVVACPDGGALRKALEQIGVETRCVSFPPWRKVMAYAGRRNAIRRLREIIVEVRPALIHVNDIWWVPQSLRASAGLGVPILAHVRQEIEPPKVRRYGLDQVDVVLAVSRHIQQSLEAGGVHPERLATVYSGIDMRCIPPKDNGGGKSRLFGIPVDVPVIGTVANLFPRKGYEVMLQALPRILATFPNVHYIIIGRGDAGYERTLRSLARTLGVEQAVHFVGFQEEVYSCLAAMDICVHPALMEGFGIAVLEAMAMEKPVVASRVGGIPEVVQHEATGLLVPPGDSEALASAVLRLLKEPYSRQHMGKAGKERLEMHFTLDQTMRTLQNVYAKLLSTQDRVEKG